MRTERRAFDPRLIAPNEELTIVVDGVQGRFRTTNWYITAAVTLLSGILAYFVSGRALKPLRSFTSQVEQVQLNNLADMRIDEDAISEFRQLSRSFNQMLERLNNAFSAQRQFTGNAAHELRTPLALMQAQLELFSAEHPDVRPETAEFLTLLREQTERLIQMTRTLLEMSNLRQVARNERIQLAPMIEEIFTDLAPLSDKLGVTLTTEGDGIMTGSDALIYRLIFNLTENAVKYNRPGGSVRVSVTQELEKLLLRVSDTGCGIPEVYQRSIFQPFFRVDKSRSREYGGAGLGALTGMGDRRPPRRLRLGREKFGDGHYHCGGVANATINEALKPFLFVFRRFACRPAAFLSVWGGQPEREASLFNLKFFAARVRVYVRQLADGRVFAVVCGQPVFEVGVVGADEDGGVFLVKIDFGGLFLLGKSCSHRLILSAALSRNRGVFQVFSSALDLGKMAIFKQERAGRCLPCPTRSHSIKCVFPALHRNQRASSLVTAFSLCGWKNRHRLLR